MIMLFDETQNSTADMFVTTKEISHIPSANSMAANSAYTVKQFFIESL